MIIQEAWNMLCMLAPWLFLGATLAGLLHVLIPADWLKQNLRGRKGVGQAVLLGVPLPLCSCGVIPAGIGLKRSGASDGASIGFLISTPQTGIDSILVSASFFGWPFAIFKMILAAITGVVGGLLAKDTSETEGSSAEVTDQLTKQTQSQQGSQKSLLPVLESSASVPINACSNQSETSIDTKVVKVFQHGIEIVQSIWLWLAIGILVSAVITVWVVPTGTFQKLSESGILISCLLVLLISVPLYVCATASVPIAASLVEGGMPVAAALVFLIAGPATNVATIGAIYKHFHFRNTCVYLGTIIVGSIFGALIFDAPFAPGALASEASHHHHHEIGIFAKLCGGLLLGMFVWFAGQDARRLIAKRNRTDSQSFDLAINIVGMHCGSCVGKVEQSLRRLAHVKTAEVDLQQNKAYIQGNPSHDSIHEAVENAGFSASAVFPNSKIVDNRHSEKSTD